MKYLIITFINLFLYIQLSGQEHLFEFSPNKPIQTNEIKKNNKNYLKIAPLGFVTSAYELGYERLLNSTYSIELSLTYFDHFENSYYARNNGYRVLMD